MINQPIKLTKILRDIIVSTKFIHVFKDPNEFQMKYTIKEKRARIV